MKTVIVRISDHDYDEMKEQLRSGSPRHPRVEVVEEVSSQLSEVANALAVAAPLTTALRRGVGDPAEETAELEGAIERAVRAMRQMQPRQDRGQDRG
jgi:hypothetical protein